MQGEREALLSVAVSAPPSAPASVLGPVPRNSKYRKLAIKVLTQALASALTSVNAWGNSYIFRLFSETGVSSETASAQSLIRNLCGGMLQSSGVALGEALGKNEHSRVQRIVITSYTMTAILTVLTSIGYGATYYIFPEIYAKDVAAQGARYFLWSELGNWPTLALTPMGQIAFQCGDWKSPLLSTALFRLSAIALSYVFAVTVSMGGDGVGVGNGLAPWLPYMLMAAWLHYHNQFDKVRDWFFTAVDFLSANYYELKSQTWLGLKMASQRATEYANISITTAVLGHQDDTNLVAINPSQQMITFFNLLSQGIGTAANMLSKTEHASFEEALRENNLGNAKKHLKEIRSIILFSLLSGTAINVVCAAIMYFARQPMVDFFISKNATEETRASADALMLVNAIGLIPDSARIISSNLLNTYDKIVTPNAISFLLMTLVGIPLNYAFSGAMMSMFWIRNVTMAVASIANLIILYRAFSADEKKVVDLHSALLPATGVEHTIQEAAERPVGCVQLLLNWMHSSRSTGSAAAGAYQALHSSA